MAITNFEGHFRKFRQLIIKSFNGAKVPYGQRIWYLDGTELCYTLLYSSFRLCRVAQAVIILHLFYAVNSIWTTEKNRGIFSSRNMAEPYIIQRSLDPKKKGLFIMDNENTSESHTPEH